MNVVGLDLSLASTGCAEVDGSTSVVRVPYVGVERLIAIRDIVLKVCYQAELVVIEGYSFASRNSQAHSIGELGGVIRVGLEEAGLSFVEVSPKSRAKYATGNGAASKDAVLAQAVKRSGIAFSTSDEADAWILRAMALDYYGEPVIKVPAVHREALNKVEWLWGPA